MTDRDRDQAAETIFAGAVERATPAERAAFLDHACGGDAALRAWVDALLAAHDGAGGFLGGAPPGAFASSAGPEALTAAAADPGSADPGLVDEGPGTIIG